MSRVRGGQRAAGLAAGDARWQISNIYLLEGCTLYATAKIFQNGRSQAVRLPKAFRFEGCSEVLIERDGDAVILRPPKRPAMAELIAALDEIEPFPERERPDQPDAREAW